MKCYSYIRFSSKEQRLGGSRERQHDKAKKFADKMNWDMDESLCMYDEGLSAFHAVHRSRGELGVFLKLVEAGKIETPSALLVENLDRLSREQVTSQLTLFLGIIEAGITIVTLMDERIYDKKSLGEDTSQLFISISIMARAHEESKSKQDRRGYAWEKARKNARKGKKIKARCAGWLKLNKKTGEFEYIEKHVESVRRIYELYLDGHGVHTICKILNKEKRTTFHKSTKGWGHTQVKRLLETRAVIGEIQFMKTASTESGKKTYIEDGDAVKDYYPAIIDEDTFYQAQQLQKIKKGSFGKVGKMNNLFSGIVRCGYCGATKQFGVRGRNKIKYLMCRNAKTGLCSAGMIFSFKYKDLEDAFLSYCSRLKVNDIISDEMSDNKKQIENLRKQVVTLTSKIEESKIKVDNFSEAIGSGSIDFIALFRDKIEVELAFQKDSKDHLQELSAEIVELESVEKKSSESLKSLQTLIEQLKSEDDTVRLSVRRKLQKNIKELVTEIKLYQAGKYYVEMFIEDDSFKHLVHENKAIHSRRMAQYREAEIHFRAGGVMVLAHDYEKEGLRLAWETEEDNRITKKTLDGLAKNDNISAEILEEIATQEILFKKNVEGIKFKDEE
ncbi:recombinase family protein [Desulfopila sp. IMCC35008]|uniref:recombinase family protein n=1 Tax=Desulfopila sp. IMCC35008 TaxID=2653858 RepID=UPI0013D441C6|nr:recombinase family protein [Desulfopila sp. IMCC35008]